MSVNVNWDGLNKFKRKIKKIEQKRDVPLTDLFTDGFIRQNTDFQTLQAMVDACGIEEMKKETDKFQKFISTHTHFKTWKEMLESALANYYKRQLKI
jgi:hypothetical protein